MTWTTALSNSMKLWAMPCRATQDGWIMGGEFWQNLVHWRREWQTTSIFLLWEPCEQYEKAKRWDTERWTPRSVGAQYAARDQWRNNSRKNEETEPKWKQLPAVDVTGDTGKVQCHKDQYCVRKAMTNLDSILKSRDITLPAKVHLVKAMVFPVLIYGY